MLTIPVIITVFFVATRWPGLLPLNFSAAYAFFFCAGLYGKKWPWWLPFGAVILTDVGLNLFYYNTAAVQPFMLVNYAAFGLIYGLGKWFSPHGSLIRLMGGGLVGAMVFYLVTNTAAWLQNPAYAKSLWGWIQALTVGEAGWPQTWTFFRNTLLSGGLFTGFIVGAIRWCETSETAEEEEEKEEETEAEPQGELQPGKSES